MIRIDNSEQIEKLTGNLPDLMNALSTAATLAETVTGARTIVLHLCSGLLPDVEVTDCISGDPEDVAALRKMTNALTDRYEPLGRMARQDPDAQSYAVCQLGETQTRSGIGRALFLRTGECIGAVGIGLPENGSDAPPPALDQVAANFEFLLDGWWARFALEQDLSDSRKRALRLQRISETDPLTGLENTSTFEGKVRERLTDPDQPSAFILIDIDHFKMVNDLYGHQFGDTYLKTVSKAIYDSFQSGSVVGRLGGDEFGVLTDLPKLGDSYLRSLLSRCRNTILRATAYLNKPELGRVSIGAAHFPDHSTEYEHLYQKADLALYASKASGRGMATVYSEEVGNRFDQSELAKTFQTACRAGQVVPYFQPIIDLATGEARAFEVLCRWENPRHGVITAEMFSAIFEDHNLATLLTRHMIQSALKYFSEGQRSLKVPAKMSLNVTYFDLMDREFVFDFQAALSDFNVDWSSIIIEVQETVVMGEQNGQVFRSLEELRRRGAQIALDDFGTGYGALRHLKNWPVDIVKIDKSFVRDLCTDYRDRAIVSSIIRLAKELGFSVVAEGIETRDQSTHLVAMGCEFGQGFIYGRPQGTMGFATRLMRD
ncbi:bifunctional diguanylate cyclase/phosphodiesterase [Pseudooceanicola sediminis]|uniref:Bifunctional diguanylate cyclase/phosphodiesterase n=1 Tax=Pseudooceanicola sediminis TaxID=2211117 RepID=A0A399IXB2_9RHOB|nr:bifunctional diguanylate cyclase/phosphodiesterase [Pseudooceanicola sediminis]KAA2312996.1 bifunctional diguanylate cyclase/phosphodiesterase [Puniceibacterium sp. HSS470]RII37604.1 bifunctional diguanylate cyclase/phosphodiesterase [Pseudooceanicola sediminis]|tara:strand:- start:36737 stop:38542 length:1806 start_codon:yes stop_codon:yes gene_type:complete